MNTTARIAAIGACAAFFAGCGGGGSTPQTAMPKAAPSPTSSPIGSASLTIKFPANFHVAKLGGSKSTSRSSRKPAYVNPSTNDTLTVYLDGASQYSNSISPLSSQGTQTITLPIFSASSHTIVAIETDGDNILSIGEADLAAGGIAPGSTASVGLTMLMNAQFIGVMSDPNNGNSDAEANEYDSPYLYFTPQVAICSAGQTLQIYPFTSDIDGGFVSGSSAGGGAPLPGWVGSTASDSAASADSVAPISSNPQYGLTITYQDTNTSEGPILTYTTQNPVYPVWYNTYYNGGSNYQGIETLVNNDTISLSQLNSAPTITAAFFIPPSCDL